MSKRHAKVLSPCNLVYRAQTLHGAEWLSWTGQFKIAVWTGPQCRIKTNKSPQNGFICPWVLLVYAAILGTSSAPVLACNPQWLVQSASCKRLLEFYKFKWSIMTTSNTGLGQRACQLLKLTLKNTKTRCEYELAFGADVVTNNAAVKRCQAINTPVHSIKSIWASF